MTSQQRADLMLELDRERRAAERRGDLVRARQICEKLDRL